MPGIFLNINPDHALTVGWLVKMSVGFKIESSDKTEEKDFLKQNKAKNRKNSTWGGGRNHDDQEEKENWLLLACPGNRRP